MKTLLVRSLDEWREWLTEHHASASEVWLIFHKRHTGVVSIDYKDARDEAELKASGRLKPPGIERPPTDRGYGPRPSRLAMPSKLPAYIQAELRNHPRALRHFEALPPSQRRRYLAWIEAAKREDTKLRRLKESIRLLAGGKVLGLK
jgi:uncharacterized protein YdeI (YjbR/CyaY-like superfamily)